MSAATQLSQFRLSEHETVWIELQELPLTAEEGTGIRRTARPQAEQERGFQAAIERIRPAAAAVFEALRELNTPRRIELEFGIGFSGRVGAFIAAADTSANFKVKLIWKNERPAPPAST